MTDDPASAAPVLAIGEATGFPISPSAMTAAMGGPPTAPALDDQFSATIAPVGGPLGLTKLGCMIITVAPGKRAFPFHNHHGADEMFVILEGEGIYRFGEAEHAVKAGDICGAPSGGPETAHQLINTGAAPLRYLGISSAQDPDVVEYPDSGKIAALAIGPGRSFQNARLTFVARASDAAGYWDGEGA